jgi:hypothetical protein
MGAAALAPSAALAQLSTPQSLPNVEIVAPALSALYAPVTDAGALNYTPLPAAAIAAGAAAFRTRRTCSARSPASRCALAAQSPACRSFTASTTRETPF